MRDNLGGGALTEVTFFILLSLYKKNHGYNIMQFVERQTEGRLVLGAGSLYGAINTMAEKGWIVQLEGDGRKKEYIITEKGKTIALRERNRLVQTLKIADEIMEVQ